MEGTTVTERRMGAIYKKVTDMSRRCCGRLLEEYYHSGRIYRVSVSSVVRQHMVCVIGDGFVGYRVSKG